MSGYTSGRWAAKVFQTERFVDRPEGTIYAHSENGEIHSAALVAERVTAPKDEEVEVNARLIAAAPELYEAAKQVWEQRGNIDEGHLSPYEGFGSALWKLRTAIVKAEEGK